MHGLDKIYKNLTNFSEYLNGQGQSCSKIMFRTHVLEHARTHVPKNHVLEHNLEHMFWNMAEHMFQKIMFEQNMIWNMEHVRVRVMCVFR